MNKYYEKALNTQHDRRPVFEWVRENVLKKTNNPTILEIGCSRNLDPESIFGDGFSSLYWADYIQKSGGSLTIVDLDPQALENCKVILSDFIGKINLSFICADGWEFLKKDNNYDFIYLDAGNEEYITYECFRQINRTKTSILLDDANGWERGQGKCVRTRLNYPDYKLFKCNWLHEMIFYPIVTENNKTFKIGKLELKYVREGPNSPWRNERAVEVALGKYFIYKHNYNVKEVGAVMPYYGEEKHEIFDPYDPHPLSRKVDVFDLDLRDCNCLSISTVEHILFDEGYNKQKDENASFRAVQKIVRESENYLITFPIGANRKLEQDLINQTSIKYVLLKRDNYRGEINNWYQVKNNDKWFNENYLHFDYQAGYYGSAGIICIITNLSEILSNE